MCTTIGFPYKEGVVFGRTLEIGIELDNKILYIPKDTKDFIEANGMTFPSKYAVLGTSFYNIESFGDGINEMGLMGSSNFFPRYATYTKHPVVGRISMTISNAFDYLLSRCSDVEEVKERAKKIAILKYGEDEEDVSTPAHFFFEDAKGRGVVIEPKEGMLLVHDNPYGVLTNSPDFLWHTTNLKNYINLKAENIEVSDFNGNEIFKLGEGTGMLGLPGDFTPPSRFIRAAYFVSNTDKNLDRQEAIVQGFRILSQFDIPQGAIVDPIEGHQDQTLYISIMDTKRKAYYIKTHKNLNIQSFFLEDYIEEDGVKFIEVEKTMNL